MLVITRTVGQSVIIGEPAKPLGTVTIGRCHDGRVRLVFDFGKSITIHREEVVKSILGQEAAKGAAQP